MSWRTFAVFIVLATVTVLVFWRALEPSRIEVAPSEPTEIRLTMAGPQDSTLAYFTFRVVTAHTVYFVRGTHVVSDGQWFSVKNEAINEASLRLPASQVLSYARQP